jgi:hypothetical protein
MPAVVAPNLCAEVLEEQYEVGYCPICLIGWRDGKDAGNRSWNEMPERTRLV